MITCGWCHAATVDADRCSACQHVNPRQPWEQRGLEVPVIATNGGRPALDEQEIRHRYAEARAALELDGKAATVEAIAERLDRTARTVRDWRRRYSLR